MGLKKLTLFLAFMMLNVMLFAQVTTSGISGKIVGQDNLTLPGATVVALHVPSGTKYAALSDSKGYYRIPNMRIGGPYKISISFVGFNTVNKENINLDLGQTLVLNISMAESVQMLKGVEITSSRTSVIDGSRTGASVNVSRQQITTLPTISRSINDFTRLSPQGSGNSSGSNSSSFGGQDGRYNNITIDGANFNNNFGLSTTKNLPGGDAQPISLDAIEEVSINIAPFDVRQSNFTGATVNAVTRSGDNTFKGSVYTYYRDKSFNGNKVGDTKLDLSNTTTKSYGARLGGPIIKDKLFFFANVEKEISDFPGVTWKATDPANPQTGSNISRTTTTDLETMRKYLIDTYKYDPGNYKDFGNFNSENYKILGRLDWNINKHNKFTVRYNYVHSNNDVQINATSAPALKSTYGRYSTMSMAFDGSNYGSLNTVGSITAELNSTFGNNIANKLFASYTKIRDTRSSKSDQFPFVDIYQNGYPYMSFGYELFTYQNDVKNNVFNITDNVNFFLGNHTITAGASYEKQYFGNSYKPYGTSYYRYASMSDFMTGKAPTVFGLTYPYEGAGDGYAELNFGYISAYVQDEYQVTQNFKITGGIRFELPQYLDKLKSNPAVNALTFKDINGNDQKLDVGSWPKAKISVSPRLGFNWDVKGDHTLQVRGGTGIFTGRLPFVWFTNQPTNSGVIQNTVSITDAATLKTLTFNPDPNAYVTKFPQQPSTVAPGQIAVVSKDFKMPQVWRSDLAADVKLPWYDLILTVEGIYSKDYNAVIQYNANQGLPSSTFSGADNRPLFTAADKKINSAMSNAIVLDNANQGHTYSLSVQITKPITKGFYGSIAYTYCNAKDLGANPGAQAVSVWSSTPALISQNNTGLSYSQFAIPHRIVGTISYRAEYLKHLATTATLIYEGSSQGRLSYVYSTDMNQDGNSEDLMYIPKNESEIHFTDITQKINNVTTVVYTAAQQMQAFWAYVDQDKYLSKHKGEYAERYGVVIPWYNRFDMKVLQDIYTKFGKDRTHTLQLSLDLLNIGNLINSHWGVRKKQALGSYDITLLKYVSKDAGNVPYYQLNTDASGKLPQSTYVNLESSSTTWGAQVGLRYTF